MGDRLLDGGNGTVTNHHGDHSFGGFCVLEVADRDEAIATARNCPILASGGRVELMELGEQTRQIGPAP
ncbi:YciI family protein [Porticoccus sp.]